MPPFFRTLRAAIPPSLPYYVLAGILVGAFIETFAVWQAMNARLGGDVARWVPPFLLMLLLLILGGWRGWTGQPGMLVASVCIAIAALFLTDPAFPAKRIHVAEYILLSIVVRRALCFHARGLQLTAFTVIITMLLGVHDEMIQGLHPDRTFGLRDIVVNGVSGTAGALIAAGLRLFEDTPLADKTEWQTHALTGAFVGGGVLLLLVAMPWFRDTSVPWWTITPLLAAGFAWFLPTLDESPKTNHPQDSNHPMTVSVCLALSTSLYPVIANGTSLVFH